MSLPDAKRLRVSEEVEDKSSTTIRVAAKDPVIGLDVCGKKYYCHQSTLVNASPYFSSRFKGDFNASVAYVDERGRDVFFVERLPSTFPFIFEFMISGGTLDFPSFQKDSTLIRNLRMEADFFGLQGLTELLKVTKSFSPEVGNKGVLYWLGTEKGVANYQNPFKIGAIHVGGWMDDAVNRAIDSVFETASSVGSRASFVHYQQRLSRSKEPRYEKFHKQSFSLFCDHGQLRLPVILDMKSISIRPTHYSLRVSQCQGMQGDWNFEGSHDGNTWDVLHAARNDQSLNLEVNGKSLDSELAKLLPGSGSEEDLADAVLGLLEQDFRHTWELKSHPSKFYRYFRIIGAGGDEGVSGGCLHGEGIELFGDVYEE